MAVEVGLLAASIATAIAGATAAATTDGLSAILAAVSALIGGIGLASVAAGLIRRDLARITRPLSLLLIVAAILLHGIGASLIAVRAQGDGPSRPAHQPAERANNGPVQPQADRVASGDGATTGRRPPGSTHARTRESTSTW